MSETLGKPGLSLETDAVLVCCACGYDLRGLGHDGVCPECATEVQSSIHAAIEAEHAARTGRLPLPSWLRIARSGYLAAAVTLITAPWLLPEIAKFFGLPSSLYRTMFGLTLFLCAIPTAAFGIALAAVLSGYGSRWHIAASVMAILLILVALPGLGS